jgi:hypothetical protein
MVNIVKYQLSHPVFGGISVEYNGGNNVDYREVFELIKMSLINIATEHGMHAMVAAVQALVLHIHNYNPDDNNTIYVCSHCL